jgi:hypothetical protein
MPGLNALMAAVRMQESQDSLDGYAMTNGDALGAYQFERAPFITTEYIVVVKQDDGTFVDTWPGKNGITGYSDWLDITNPDIRKIQDSAFLEWIMYQWRQIRGDDAEPLAGQTLNGVELTISGMVLGAHLIGETDFRTTYIRSGGTSLLPDGNGKTAADYEQQFGGYDLTDLTGVDPDIIPAGFASYFVTNHDLANTFNRHSDDNIDLIGNSNTDDYPMHMGTGDDRIYGFGGDDTVYAASGGNDYLDGGTDEEGDVLSYFEFDGPVSITLVGTDVHAPSPTPVFVATTSEGSDTFLNFETIVMTEFSDTFIIDPAAESSLQQHGIFL